MGDEGSLEGVGAAFTEGIRLYTHKGLVNLQGEHILVDTYTVF